MGIYYNLKKILYCFLLLGLLCGTAAADTTTGDRIWDGNDGQSDDEYTWTAQSFSGFYYDLDSGFGSENMTIKDIDDNIGEGDLEYTTEPIETDFEYSKWDSYQVIGFMAEKYFAGYIDDQDPVNKEISLIKDGVLSKVLIDSDDRESVYSGSSLELENGYSLYIAEVDINGESVWVQLKKNDKVVDDGFVRGNEDYTYKMDLGDAEDVPIIIAHFGSVFSGRESTATFIEGIFQISDDVVEIETGDTFGEMEIDSVTSSEIKMQNKDDISLDEGKTIEIMGKLKIRVADDSDLRFAPVLDMSEPGAYELRGTVYDEEIDNSKLTWTPLNFEGFYYNIDEGIGTETLRITTEDRDAGERSIEEGDLEYSTTSKDVEFENSRWGEFQVIGFMAEKYFAGYIGEEDSPITSENISLLSDNLLSKVLIDNDDKKSLYTGSSLELEEGYTLKIQEVDLNGDKIWVQLEKDGKAVDNGDGFLSSKDVYIYEKDLVKADDVPLIMVGFESVFAGRETNAVSVKGIFQISEDCIEIEDGKTFGKMEISSIGDNSIKMKNKDEDITLSRDDTIDIMNNIKFKVADSSDLRFYPFVEVNTEGAEDRILKLSIPDEITVDESFNIKVTADGNAVEDATVKLDGKTIGNTDEDGIRGYTPETLGTFELIVEKEGYVSAKETIKILEAKERMSISFSPNEVYTGDTVTIELVEAIGGDPIKNAEVSVDGKSLGETGSDGTITFTPEEADNVRISASAEGFIEESETLKVKAPEPVFVFSNLNIKQTEVKAGKEVGISVNATNTGNAAGSHNVELLVNGNVKESKEISLNPAESKTVEFAHAEAEPGSYTVKVEDQTASYEVVKKLPFIGAPMSLAVLLIAFVLLRKRD